VTETWYAYECYNAAGCRWVGGGLSGVVADVRLPDDVDPPPEIVCPSCGQPMVFKGRHAADPDGY